MTTNNPIEEKIARGVTREDLVASSGICYGAGGASLAMVLLLAQIQAEKSLILLWSLGFASFSMPVFVGLAVADQMWVSLQLTFLDMHRIKWLRLTRVWSWMLACISLLLSISCLIFSMSTWSGWLFVALTIIIGPAVIVGLPMTVAKLLLHRIGRQENPTS